MNRIDQQTQERCPRRNNAQYGSPDVQGSLGWKAEFLLTTTPDGMPPSTKADDVTPPVSRQLPESETSGREKVMASDEASALSAEAFFITKDLLSIRKKYFWQRRHTYFLFRQHSVFNLFFKILIWMLLGFALNHAKAQQISKSQDIAYQFEGSVGLRNWKMKSNIQSLDHVPASLRGGAMTVRIGNPFWQVRLTPIGFYKSTPSPLTQTRITESTLKINFNLLQWILPEKSPFDVYFIAGAQRSAVKLNGSYLLDPASTVCIYQNFSTSLVNWNMMTGAGIQYLMPLSGSEVTWFAEWETAFTVNTKAQDSWFKNTSMSNPFILNVGISLRFEP